MTAVDPSSWNRPGRIAAVARFISDVVDFGEEHCGCDKEHDYDDYGFYCCGYCGCCPCGSLKCPWCRPKLLHIEWLLDWLTNLGYDFDALKPKET